MRTRTLRKDALLYLSGPMTGYEGFNYETFNDAAADLRGFGWEVINPAETAGGTIHVAREKFIRMDIGYVMAADALVMLRGWSHSQGATLEVALAFNLGLPVFAYDPDIHNQGIGLEIDVNKIFAHFNFGEFPSIEEVH